MSKAFETMCLVSCAAVGAEACDDTSYSRVDLDAGAIEGDVDASTTDLEDAVLDAADVIAEDLVPEVDPIDPNVCQSIPTDLIREQLDMLLASSVCQSCEGPLERRTDNPVTPPLLLGENISQCSMGLVSSQFGDGEPYVGDLYECVTTGNVGGNTYWGTLIKEFDGSISEFGGLGHGAEQPISDGYCRLVSVDLDTGYACVEDGPNGLVDETCERFSGDDLLLADQLRDFVQENVE